MPNVRVVREPLPAQLRYIHLKLKNIHQALKDFTLESYALYVDYDLDVGVAIPKEVKNNFIEEVYITESYFKNLALALKESLEVKDDYNKFMEKTQVVNAILEEVVGKKFDKDIRQLLELEPIIGKEIQKPLQENIKILEMYLRHAGAIISDIAIYPNVLNETDFDVAESPIGWSKFKTMVTGDYIYQKALCTYLLKAESLDSDRPNTREYVHKVDVPDTYETGEIYFDSENNPVTYRFRRPFHVVPEVNYSLKSVDNLGDISQAFILPIEATTEYIKVALKKYIPTYKITPTFKVTDDFTNTVSGNEWSSSVVGKMASGEVGSITFTIPKSGNYLFHNIARTTIHSTSEVENSCWVSFELQVDDVPLKANKEFVVNGIENEAYFTISNEGMYVRELNNAPIFLNEGTHTLKMLYKMKASSGNTVDAEIAHWEVGINSATEDYENSVAEVSTSEDFTQGIISFAARGY